MTLTGKGKTMIRTGWGVFYDAFSQDFFIGHLPYNSNNPGEWLITPSGLIRSCRDLPILDL